jgi:hypothetical protein
MTLDIFSMLESSHPNELSVKKAFHRVSCCGRFRFSQAFPQFPSRRISAVGGEHQKPSKTSGRKSRENRLSIVYAIGFFKVIL